MYRSTKAEDIILTIKSEEKSLECGITIDFYGVLMTIQCEEYDRN